MSTNRLFNNSTETAVRLLVILTAYNQSIDLQRLVYFDYLTLHYGDIDPAYPSLHPSNPFHAVEYVVRRKSVQNGLESAIRKGLLDVTYLDSGIYYYHNQLTEQFLSYLNSEYYTRLVTFARLVCNRFKQFTDGDLAEFFRNNIGKWKGEFEKEVLIRGDANE